MIYSLVGCAHPVGARHKCAKAHTWCAACFQSTRCPLCMVAAAKPGTLRQLSSAIISLTRNDEFGRGLPVKVVVSHITSWTPDERQSGCHVILQAGFWPVKESYEAVTEMITGTVRG